MFYNVYRVENQGSSLHFIGSYTAVQIVSWTKNQGVAIFFSKKEFLDLLIFPVPRTF